MKIEDKETKILELLKADPELGYTYVELGEHLETSTRDARNVVRRIRSQIHKKIMQNPNNYNERLRVIFIRR